MAASSSGTPGGITRVPASILRSYFNDGQFYERVQSGELLHRTGDYNTHLNQRQRKKADEPRCTRSQIVLYYDHNGTLVALVHQYRRRDGTLGGQGRPDPMWLLYQGHVYVFEQSSLA